MQETTMFDQPETSPWGEIQRWVPICHGVYQVSTASHGGVMLMLGQSRPEPAANENPTTARRTAPPPSGRTSGSKGSTGRDIERRPSVRQAIRELQAERTAKETQARQKQRPPHTQQHSPKKKAKQTNGR